MGNIDGFSGQGQQVACMCWFPTKGQPFPISFKYRDSEGEVHSIHDIDILDTKHIFQGIDFTCEAVFGDQKRRFSLMFFKDDYRWLLQAMN